MVRLLRYGSKARWAKKLGFNPTMVRLLPIVAEVLAGNIQAFQSHNGAIAARSGYFATHCLSRFQSHNGAIAAPISALFSLRCLQFQSHNGAIAAPHLRGTS